MRVQAACSSETATCSRHGVAGYMHKLPEQRDSPTSSVSSSWRWAASSWSVPPRNLSVVFAMRDR